MDGKLRPNGLGRKRLHPAGVQGASRNRASPERVAGDGFAPSDRWCVVAANAPRFLETVVHDAHAALVELASAFADPHTYDLARNAWFWIGLALTIPLPLAALAPELAARAATPSLHELGQTLAQRPLDGVFLGLPVVAALVGGACGTLRRRTRHRLRTVRRELARIRLELNRACARLAQLDDTRRRLIAAVSHELRTPLTAIVGYAEMLQRGRLGQLDERQTKALAVLLRAVERERAAVENLLAHACLETASYRVDRELLDLRDPARSAYETFLAEAVRRDVTLELALPSEPVIVDADAAGLELVLANLVSNAVKWTPPGGRAHLSVEPRGGRARVTVADTGPGIASHLAKRIFEPFFQAATGDTREKSGAGLGLSIVKGVLDAHGTSVSLDEPPGGGARFTFALPLAPTQLECQRTSQDPRDGVGTAFA
jgi:signal transduction histidine kinase